jgi:hypothetical protein
MGYHHDHESAADAVDSLLDHAALRRAECHELLPHEVRRMLWEGATLVQIRLPEAVGMSVQGAVLLHPRLRERQIHRLLPDPGVPLLCVGKDGERAVTLADHLRGLGYRYVFTFAGRLPRP